MEDVLEGRKETHTASGSHTEKSYQVQPTEITFTRHIAQSQLQQSLQFVLPKAFTHPQPL